MFIFPTVVNLKKVLQIIKRFNYIVFILSGGFTVFRQHGSDKGNNLYVYEKINLRSLKYTVRSSGRIMTTNEDVFSNCKRRTRFLRESNQPKKYISRQYKTQIIHLRKVGKTEGYKHRGRKQKKFMEQVTRRTNAETCSERKESAPGRKS